MNPFDWVSHSQGALMKVNTNALNRLRYGLYAPIYDPIVHLLEQGRQRSMELLDIRPGETVLIVGVGTGLDLAYLPSGAGITAVDLSPAMLRQASERAKRLGLKVDCRVMDAHRLDLPDASFDAVILHLILAVVPDPEACIQEAARVLKPDGRIAIFDKFLPDSTRPSLLRKILGALTNVLFSNINRHLGPLLRHGRLHVVQKEPSVLRGAYVVAIIKKAREG